MQQVPGAKYAPHMYKYKSEPVWAVSVPEARVMLRKTSGCQVKIPANVHKQAHRAVAPRKARQSTPDVTVDGMKPAPNGREEVAQEPAQYQPPAWLP